MAETKENLEKTKNDLFNELRELAKRANQRIVRIERFTGRQDAWAVANLRNRLDTEKLNAWTPKGRIKYNKSMNITELRAVIKATKNFLNSATSTKRGIEEVRQKQIKGLGLSLDIEEEDAEFFYRLFEDTDYSFFVPKYITASAMNDLIQESIEYRYNVDRYLEALEIYITIGNDTEMRARAIALYKKEIEPSI